MVGLPMQIANRPQFGSHHVLALPFERLNPRKIGFVMSHPDAMNNGVPFGSRIVNVCKQVEDNFNRKRIVHLDFNKCS